MNKPSPSTAGGPSVLLVSMPWTTLAEPSQGLAILKAVLTRQGIPCRIMHANLFLLEHLTSQSYHALAHLYTLNDFTFSGVLDPAMTNAQRRAMRPKLRELVNPRGGFDPLRFGGSEGVADTILRLRSEIIPSWLEGWADEIAAHPATLIGFTCMFDQTISSMALAKLVKERAPEKTIALGGYAVRSPTGEMIIESSPWIDAVCLGEGENTICELARAAAGEIPLRRVPGIVYRSPAGELAFTPPAPQIDMNDVPSPDFDDYFADLRRLSKEHQVDIVVQDLPIENSRGCWWGARSHCVFCGIKDSDMAYRHRDASRVMEVMDELNARYKMKAFRFSDYILPHKYYDTLMPALTSRGSPYVLCAELKANISEEKFMRLVRAGFVEVQPGIESFSSSVLRQMQKGVTAAKNIQTLMLGRRFGLRIFYNLIYGFPGDELADYERMVELLPRLSHLDAPVTCVPVQITRWAPLQTNPEAFGIEPGSPPEDNYDMLFSREYLDRTGFKIEDFCYYFERNFENSPALQRLYARIVDIVTEWRERNVERNSWLYSLEAGDGLLIHDRRGRDEQVIELGPQHKRVLAVCRQPVSLRALEESLPGMAGVERIAAELDERGLVFEDEGRYISLVVPGMPVHLELEEIPEGEPDWDLHVRHPPERRLLPI